jgi:hypothetical protein
LHHVAVVILPEGTPRADVQATMREHGVQTSARIGIVMSPVAGGALKTKYSRRAPSSTAMWFPREVGSHLRIDEVSA